MLADDTAIAFQPYLCSNQLLLLDTLTSELATHFSLLTLACLSHVHPV